MPEQLGRIERLEAEHFKQGKKLYLVPLVYSGEKAPDDYKEKSNRYWQQVAEQLINLATKIGEVKRVYHEAVYQCGEDGLKALERLNPSSYQIAKAQCDNGANVEAIEERELLEEVTDWQRCLMLGFISDKVADKVSESYLEAAKRRNESMAKKISETLKQDEAGLLFIGEQHSLQFPTDVEVFTIFPPALDEMHRWVREQARTQADRATEESKGRPEGEAEGIEKKAERRAKRQPKDSPEL